MRETAITEPRLQILLSLLAGPRTASDILGDIAEFDRGREPAVATFYRQLQATVEAGWARVEGPAASAAGGGRPGQRFRITAAGEELARGEARRLQRLARRALAPARRES